MPFRDCSVRLLFGWHPSPPWLLQTNLPGQQLTWILAIGSERLCSAIQSRCRLLRNRPRSRWQRVSISGPPEHFNANRFRSFVEFETAADLKTAVEKLDGREFKGVRVTCVADVCNVLHVLLVSADSTDPTGYSP